MRRGKRRIGRQEGVAEGKEDKDRKREKKTTGISIGKQCDKLANYVINLRGTKKKIEI